MVVAVGVEGDLVVVVPVVELQEPRTPVFEVGCHCCGFGSYSSVHSFVPSFFSSWQPLAASVAIVAALIFV